MYICLKNKMVSRGDEDVQTITVRLLLELHRVGVRDRHLGHLSQDDRGRRSPAQEHHGERRKGDASKIGRASCRERV